MKTRFEIRRIIPMLFLLLIGVYILQLSEIAWDTASVATAFYSVLAFLAITMTTCSLNRIRIDPTPSHRIFAAGTGYASIIFSVAGLYYLVTAESPVAHASTSGIFLNLVAFSTTAIILLISKYLETKIPEKESILNHRLLPLSFVAVGSVIFLFAMGISRLPLDQWIFLVGGFIVGSISLVSFAVLAVLTFKQEYTESTHDPIRLGLAYGLLSVVSLNHILILYAPTSLWALSMSLTAVAFIFAVIAIGYPFLVQIGVKKTTAYNTSLMISAIVVLPFVIAYVIELWLPLFSGINVGATVIIHIGSCVLAGASAYALFTRNQSDTNSFHFPIIYLLGYWSVAELFLAISHLVSAYTAPSESMVPYIVGSCITAILLSISVRRILNPKSERITSISRRLLILGIFLFALIIVVFELLHRQYLSFFSTQFGISLGIGIMLWFGFLSLFELLHLILLSTAESGGRLSFDTGIIGLVAFWVLNVILKSNFPVWSIGWWGAEITMSLSFIIFPLLLLRLYLIESKIFSKHKRRATSLSSFMSSNIESYHKAAIDSLSLLSSDISPDDRLDTIASALADISSANDFSNNLHAIIEGSRFPIEELEVMDLVDSITTGYNRALKFESSSHPKLQIRKKPGDCLVLANSLLYHLFKNIFHGVLCRIGPLTSVGVEITSRVESSLLVWSIQISIDLGPKDSEMKQLLFERYTQNGNSEAVEFGFSRRLVQLFGGSYFPKSTIDSNQNLSVVFQIGLPLRKVL